LTRAKIKNESAAHSSRPLLRGGNPNPAVLEKLVGAKPRGNFFGKSNLVVFV